jgi:extracellular factor (EF) 3-hydroxypalmitic acid methyl ester biosynthesis protein
MPSSPKESSEAVELQDQSKVERRDRLRAPTGRRLRGHRIQVADLNVAEIDAVVWHNAAGRFAASAEDLSLHGARLRFPATGESIFPGDRLERVLLSLDGTPIYSGPACVRRASEESGERVLGVEFEEDGVDLDVVYRVDNRTTFSERFVRAGQTTSTIDPKFRLWVSELEDYLCSIRTFADAEERQLDALDRRSRDSALTDYMDEARPAFVDRMLRAELELHGLVNGFTEEEHANHRRHYNQRIYPYLRESLFLRRAMDKPMGYAGDYEMMNMLYRDHAEGGSFFAWLMNAYGINVRAAEAVRNRRTLLTEAIVEALEGSDSERVRIASVGCGPAHEIQRLLEQRPHLGKKLEVVLIDQEPRSIAYCERMLAPLIPTTGVKAHVVKESIRKLIAHPSLQTALGTCDLIYSAGLFDYLDEKPFVHLAQTLVSSLSERGHLLIGNFAIGQPSRWFMEYCSEWFLIHRTPEEMLSLGEAAGASREAMSIMAEPAGINLFLDVRR